MGKGNNQTFLLLLDTGCEPTIISGDPKCRCGPPDIVEAYGCQAVRGFSSGPSHSGSNGSPNPSCVFLPPILECVIGTGILSDGQGPSLDTCECVQLAPAPWPQDSMLSSLLSVDDASWGCPLATSICLELPFAHLQTIIVNGRFNISLGCLIGTLNVMCPKPNSYFLTPAPSRPPAPDSPQPLHLRTHPGLLSFPLAHIQPLGTPSPHLQKMTLSPPPCLTLWSMWLFTIG